MKILSLAFSKSCISTSRALRRAAIKAADLEVEQIVDELRRMPEAA